MSEPLPGGSERQRFRMRLLVALLALNFVLAVQGALEPRSTGARSSATSLAGLRALRHSAQQRALNSGRKTYTFVAPYCPPQLER
jgi:hypothetical protein